MNIQESYCTKNNRYKAAEALSPVGVVLHSIGVPQPKASALLSYWNTDPSAYATHYVLDDQNIFHAIPDNFKCWHVGSPGNGKWLGIEMCEPSQIKYTSGATFTVSDLSAAQTYVEKCYKNAVWLLAKLCKEHGWNPATAILTHYEVTRQRLSNTDHVDPQHLWNGLGMGYDLATLRRDVAAAMAGSSPTPTPAPTPAPSGQMYRIRKSWNDAASQIGAYENLDYAKAACKEGYFVFDKDGSVIYPEQGFAPYLVRITAKSGLNVRSGPGTSYKIQQAIPYGGGYTIIDEENGWGLLKAYEAGRNGWVSLQYTERI